MNKRSYEKCNIHTRGKTWGVLKNVLTIFGPIITNASNKSNTSNLLLANPYFLKKDLQTSVVCILKGLNPR